MKKHYLHLSVCRCDKCQGPVVAGSLGARENEISKEIDKQEIGAICLACGCRQSVATEGMPMRHFPPVDWPPAGATKTPNVTTVVADVLNRSELH